MRRLGYTRYVAQGGLQVATRGEFVTSSSPEGVI
jgi:hypothetical protein